jgi:hypothetical protein
VKSGSAGSRLGALLLGLAFLVGAAVVVSALLGPPLFGLIDSLAPGSFPFVRVLRRLAQLVALAGLVVWMRRLGVRRPADIGLGWSVESRRDLVRGLLGGACALAAVFAYELAAGNRRPSASELSLVGATKMLAGATAIGLVEEGVCRGALLFPFAPLAGTPLVVANLGVSSLFSVAHFARGGRVTEVDAGSGWRVWRELPPAVLHHAEAAVGLFLTGALLYLLAARQGHAWGAVGVHAGAVATLQLVGTATEPIAGRDALFLVDGLLPGWGLSALLALALAFVALRRRALRT